MAFKRVLAQATVSDLDRAVAWYAKLFEREPDSRPMDGLVEWHLGEIFGVQVWAEPERAGRSSIVLDESDLEALADRLTDQGLDHPGIQEATTSRLLLLVDPDGNRVAIAGS